MTMQTYSKSFVRLLISIGILLTVPLALTLLNPGAEMRGGSGGGGNWTFTDFAAMGAMLFVAGFAGLVSVRVLKTTGRQVIALGVIGMLFLAVWAELATDAVSRVLTAAVP